MTASSGLGPFLVAAILVGTSLGADKVDYTRQVKPILAARCFACHGALKQKGGLRADTAKSLIEGGDDGPAIVPGVSGESPLIDRIGGKGDERMPPSSEGEGLTTAQVAVLKAWIDQGADAPTDETPEPDPRDHWAFRPPVAAAVPSMSRNPIDAFLAADWAKRGLKPQPAADRGLLLRRVTLDLIGLPPTDAERAAFEADRSPEAYEKVVDRLLASPQHGERWGRHWMDLWRYSDWWGLGAELRNSQKHIWHWRDWIVESVNADTGYDEMLRSMLAADELYPDDPGRLRATGFLARSYFRFNRNTWLEETVEHTGKAFLGLTLNCAKCHDHKYDPIGQADYYRFRAFFEPYQLRTDAVPGVTDFEKDGIPRAFDCNPDAPTFLFVRGDESRPAKDRPLKPGLPPLLALGDLKIEPIRLPAEAVMPGLRPFVVDDQVKDAEAQIVASRKALEGSRARLAEASADTDSKPPLGRGCDDHFFHDDYEEPNPDDWETPSGLWSYRGGKLVQGRGDETRSVLRGKFAPPSDFQARIRFTLTGGEPWRSVGLCFDEAEGREVLVYLSAYAAGPKLQVSYRRGGVDTYPPEAAQARKVAMGTPQELTVRVRGRLVNVEVDGKHALAYRLPVPRQAGSLSIITYAATAEFDQFDLEPLPPRAKLVEPPRGDRLAGAGAEVELAAKSLAVAEAQPAAIRARAAADRARSRVPMSADAKDLAARASRLERAVNLARAEEDLARAALAMIDPAKKAAGLKAHDAAKAAVEAARKAFDTPGESYKPIAGATKAPESNLETESSRGKPFPATSTGRRAALARWLTDRRHPLTARVAVNHIWMRHFGTPLVPTVFDFGRKGSPPTHPALLDWLAADFMDHGWSMKRLHRLIVTSDAYRRSSSSLGADRATLAADPENRHYWRMNPVRMEAQAVRDSLLHLAGVLDPAMGGPPVPANDESSRRRSLYFFHSHNDFPKFLATFDDANVLECYRRSESIVPAQALALSNSRLALTMAAKIGERLHQRLGTVDDPAFVRAAFETILGDAPTPAERVACERALIELKALLKAQGIADPGRRARDDLVQALLNHNDFVTIR